MYRIMLVRSNRNNYGSLYSWMTEERRDSKGDMRLLPVEYETEEEVDAKIEDMLNNDGYSKSDFIVVKHIDYTIYTSDYTEPVAGEEGQQSGNAGGRGLILRFDFSNPTYDDGTYQIYSEASGITWQEAYDAYMAGKTVVLCKHAEYIYSSNRTLVDDKIYHLTGFGQNVGANVNYNDYEYEIMFSLSDEYRENGISARVLANSASDPVCLICSPW